MQRWEARRNAASRLLLSSLTLKILREYSGEFGQPGQHVASEGPDRAKVFARLLCSIEGIAYRTRNEVQTRDSERPVIAEGDPLSSLNRIDEVGPICRMISCGFHVYPPSSTRCLLTGLSVRTRKQA